MLQGTPWELGDAVLLADALVQLRADASNVQVVRSLFTPFNARWTIRRVASSRTNLRAILLDTGQATIILFDGLSDLGTARDFVYSYGGPVNEFPGNGENPVFANLAIRTLELLGPLPARPENQWLLAGYSVGGAVAAIAAAAVQELRDDNTVAYCQFNPPRPVVTEYCVRAKSVRGFRYHCDDDAIARLPFHSNEVTVAGQFVPNATQNTCNRYVQIGRGASIGFDGAITKLGPFAVPDQPASAALNLFTWALSLDAQQVQNHSIAELARRLHFLDTNVPGDRTGIFIVGTSMPLNTDGPGADFRDPILPPAERPRAEPGKPALRPEQQAANVVNELNNPLLENGVVDAKPYYRQKISGRWYVMYLGSVLYGPVSKRVAKDGATDLNQAVTRSLDSDFRNPELLGTSLQDEIG